MEEFIKIQKQEQDINELSPLVWAYIGDSVYELYVRTYLVDNTRLKPHKLHIEATKLVKASAQAHILQELENEALIYTERTNGKFVTNDIDLIQKLKNKLVKDKIDVLINEMKQIGITKDELLEYLRGE